MRTSLVVAGLAALVAAQPPAVSPQVTRLHDAAVRYERIVDAEDWIPIGRPARVVSPGDALPDAGRLHEHLVVLGDLPAHAPPPDTPRLTEALSAGLRRFQARHGLVVDGVLGPATAAALAVPPSRRLAQIRIAIDRLSALDLADRRPTILVNVPMAYLWAWDGAPWQQPAAIDMKVIVGKPSTPTPTFESHVESITFRPFWDVPVSIAVQELWPQILRDPAYLARHHFDIVPPDGRAVPFSGQALGLFRSGALRLRQRPGADNALGLVRFDVPNPYSVFLHDTPARAAFARPSRHLSHGCIRLERPAALVRWALADEAWTDAAIEAAFDGIDGHAVPATRPVRLLVVSVPALVTDDGDVWFAGLPPAGAEEPTLQPPGGCGGDEVA